MLRRNSALTRPLRVRQLRRSPSPAPHVRLSSDPAGRSRPSGPTACASSYLRPVRCREMRLHRPARTVNTLTRPTVHCGSPYTDTEAGACIDYPQ